MLIIVKIIITALSAAANFYFIYRK